jgi:hypothetical protein
MQPGLGQEFLASVARHATYAVEPQADLWYMAVYQ